MCENAKNEHGIQLVTKRRKPKPARNDKKARIFQCEHQPAALVVLPKKGMPADELLALLRSRMSSPHPDDDDDSPPKFAHGPSSSEEFDNENEPDTGNAPHPAD